jgi:ribonuclease HI
MAIRYYVVWEGKVTGVFTDWVKCQSSIQGYKEPKYKSYKSLEEANKAFAEGYEAHWGKGDRGLAFYTSEELKQIGAPKVPSICVNSSCDMLTKVMTYQGLDTRTGEVLFRQGPFFDCDQHIGEFLALVHGLAYLYKQGSTIPVYTRSRHAMLWVQKEKQYGGRLALTANNENVHELVKRGIKWLAEKTYDNEILLWNKRAWNHPGKLTVDLSSNAEPQVGQ